MDEARVRDIQRVLGRGLISRAQLVLYKLALDRGEEGFSSEDVRKALSFDSKQFRGVLSSLGRRISGTPLETAAAPKAELMFSQAWTGQQYHYRPRPELLVAFERLPALAQVLAEPLAAVASRLGGLRVELPPEIPAKPEVASPPVELAVVPTPPPSPFHEILSHLRKGGLHFPDEVVANVLLALQVKRFVILTGIAGTGKTRIGQAIAAHLPLVRKIEMAKDPQLEAVEVTLAPYVSKYHRLTLPNQIRDELLPNLTEKGAGEVNVRWPGGAVKLVTYRHGGGSLVVLFKGPLRKWMETTFKTGDLLVLRLEGPKSGPLDTLVFEQPKATEIREVPVRNTELIPVRPDWTDHRGLLGFYNPITQRYVPPPFLRLLLAASEEARLAQAEGRDPHPFFALLDEMNLARVEHYFSDLLSAMESAAGEGETAGHIPLHDEMRLEEGEVEEGVALPRSVRVPPNFFIIGTVNVDESTYMCSPKVLDRAFTVEFNHVDLEPEPNREPGDLDIVRWSGKLVVTRSGSEDRAWLESFRDLGLGRTLRDLLAVLRKTNRHFGYRVADEIAGFVRRAAEQVNEEDAEDAAYAALDLGFLQKVLVKLAGTQAELGEVLDDLLWFMIAGRAVPTSERIRTRWQLDGRTGHLLPTSEADDDFAWFPRSAGKLWRMQVRLQVRGFTAWIE